MKFCPNSDLQSAVDDFIQFLKINSKHSITNEKYDELRNLLLRRIYEMPFLVRYYSKLTLLQSVYCAHRSIRYCMVTISCSPSNEQWNPFP